MAGRIRREPYPASAGIDVNPQEFDPAYPDIPQGYKNWNEYVLAVLDANDRGERGPIAYNVYGQDILGEMQPLEFLINNLGYGRLAPYLDTSNPRIQQFLDSTYYSNTSHDAMNIFGDQFMQALMGLGAFVGGSAALGAFSTPAVAGGEAAIAAAPAAEGAVGGGLPLGAAAGGGGGVVGGAGAGGAGAAAAGGGTLATLADLAPIIGSVISAGGGLLGAGMGAGAARDVAQTQADAATQANALLAAIYAQQRADMEPWRQAGLQALPGLQALAGQSMNVTPWQASPVLQANQFAFTPGGGQGSWLTQPVAGVPTRGTASAPIGDTMMTNAGLDVGMAGGTMAAAAAPPAGMPTGYTPFQAPVQAVNPNDYAFKAPTFEEVQRQDHGYQFRLQEGLKALQASRAAKGGLLSGGALRGAQQYAQGLASQEYGNAYNRALGENELRYGRAVQQNQDLYGRALTENQMGYERALTGNELAYNRAYQQNADEQARRYQEYLLNLQTQLGLRNQQYNELANLAGIGQTTGANLAQLAGQYGQQAANNLTSAGAAQAAGRIGASNAWMGGLSNLGNTANNYLQYQLAQQLLRTRR